MAELAVGRVRRLRGADGPLLRRLSIRILVVARPLHASTASAARARTAHLGARATERPSFVRCSFVQAAGSQKPYISLLDEETAVG